jgi:NADPH:quinone reductase-like Zn-dependent oxidoreductase
MFAVYVDKPDPGRPLEALRIGERPVPEMDQGWVKVRMSAASLNWHDLWTLRGMGAANGRPEVFPMILGCDGVGSLENGSRVIIYPVVGDAQWKGDETQDPTRSVFSEHLQGTFAEFAIVPGRNAVPLPDNISDSAAAVLGASWLTAYRMLFTHSGLRPGQTMLVQGATGGVATALIQLGRAAGQRVWATGRTPAKRSIAEQLGAHQTFAHGEALPYRADAVFEPVGAVTWAHSMASIKTGGTIVVCGVASGNMPALDLAHVFIEQLTIKGVFAGTLAEFENLLQFVSDAKIEPRVSHIVPMSEAADAFRLMLDGDFQGKIVLKR